MTEHDKGLGRAKKLYFVYFFQPWLINTTPIFRLSNKKTSLLFSTAMKSLAKESAKFNLIRCL